MSVGLRPYPACENAGLPWLAEIPQSWMLLRAKHVFNCVDLRSETGDEELLTVSSNKGVVPRSENQVTMFMAESYVGHKLCWPGDLVINSLWAWAGGLGFSRRHGIVSSAYGVYRPRHEFSGLWTYFDYLLRSKAYVWELQVRSKGIWVSRLQLTDESFLDMPIVIPSRNDAVAIVRFLDHFDRRINRLIRVKRRMIELLNEQKQAITQKVVTRGLDPNVRLKPSGVEWLGEIPEHWEVRRLKALSRMKSGEGITSASIDSTGPYAVWGGNGVRGYTSAYTHDGEFIVIGRQGALCGNVHRVHGSFWASEHAVVVTMVPGLDIDWYAALLTTMNLNQYSIAAAQPGLAVERVLNLSAPVPPNREQTEIVRHIESATVGIQSAVSRAKSEIHLLREYRTRLIADVVTGKLDVREAAAQLPDEPNAEPDAFEEVEPLNDTGAAVEDGEEEAEEVTDGR